MAHRTWIRPCTGPGRFGLAGLATALVLVPVSVAGAQDSGPTPTTVEAWYQPPVVGGPGDPACGLLGDCPTSVPVPGNPYAESTLHVGAAQGRPESTTYLTFDALTVPAGMTLVGGTAILPVAGTEDGTAAPELAELLACLATTPFEPVEAGSTTEAPATDCNINAPAVYVADGDVPHFEVDLAPFVESWQRRDLAALALIPLPGGTATWHAAFSARDRDVEGAAPPISATFQLGTAVAPPPSPTPTPAPSASPSAAPTASPTPAASASPAVTTPVPPVSPPPRTSPGLSTGQGTVVTPEPPIVASSSPSPLAVAPTAPTSTDVAQEPVATLRRPYPYRSVFLLPLILLLFAAGMGRALQSDIRVRVTT